MNRFGLVAAALVAAAVSFSPALAGPNLIANGDFSNGNDGSFTSGYSYVAPTANSMYPEGLYTIASNPNSVHNLWVTLPGSNPQMIVNGATDGATPVWGEDAILTTKAGTYKFSADVTNVCCDYANFDPNANAPSEITFQVSVNGGSWTDVGSYTTSPADSGVANLITGSFMSTAGGHFDIRAVNAAGAASGNDFALDNISVAAVPEPAAWAMMLFGFFGLGSMVRFVNRKNYLLAQI
jgi:hypothetical protein